MAKDKGRWGYTSLLAVHHGFHPLCNVLTFKMKCQYLLKLHSTLYLFFDPKFIEYGKGIFSFWPQELS